MKTIFTTILLLFLTAFIAADTIRGVVVDSEGDSITGAEVYVVYDDIADTSHRTLSAEDGTFELDVSFLNPEGGKRFWHYDLIATKDNTLGIWNSTPFGNWLIPENNEVKLKPAIRVRGKVVDENDKPIADAEVRFYWSSPMNVTSDEDGRFELLVLSNQSNFTEEDFRVFKDGYALAPLPFLQPTEEPVVLRLTEKRKKAAFRTVDVEGEPISGVLVGFGFIDLSTSDNQKVIGAHISRRTDSNGRVSFDCIPDSASKPIPFIVHSDMRFSPANYRGFNPNTDSGKEIQIIMLAPVKLDGVIRYEDGTPLADTVISLSSRLNLFTSNDAKTRKKFYFNATKTDRQGKYEFFVYPDLVYLAPQIAYPDKVGGVILDDDLEGRIVFPDQPVSDFDFIVQKLYRVHGHIHVPSDFKEEMLSTGIDGKKQVFLFFSDVQFPNYSPPQKVTDSQGEQIEYYKSMKFTKSTYTEFHQNKPMEYEIWLPKGQFSIGKTGGNIEQKTFDVTGDEPEIVVDLTLAKQKE